MENGEPFNATKTCMRNFFFFLIISHISFNYLFSSNLIFNLWSTRPKFVLNVFSFALLFKSLNQINQPTNQPANIQYTLIFYQYTNFYMKFHTDVWYYIGSITKVENICKSNSDCVVLVVVVILVADIAITVVGVGRLALKIGFTFLSGRRNFFRLYVHWSKRM